MRGKQPDPTQDELRELVSAGRGLYEILMLDDGASVEDIKKSYRKLARQYHPDKVGHDSPKMVDINKAYKILSNERMRYLYDNFYVTDDGEVHRSGAFSPFEDLYSKSSGGNRHNHQTSKEELQELLTTISALLTQLAATPFRNIAMLCQTVKGHIAPMAAARSIYRQLGFRGFWRGFFSQQATSFVGDRVSSFLTGITMQLVVGSKTASVHPLIHHVWRSFFEYPFDLILTWYFVRYEFDSTFDIFNQLLERGYRSFWIGFFFNFAVDLLGGQIDVGINYLKSVSLRQYTLNPQSKFWRYLNFALSSRLFNTFIFTSIMTPFTSLSFQRQLQALLPTSKQLSILQLLKQNLSFGGISRLYSGLIPYTIYLSAVDLFNDDLNN